MSKFYFIRHGQTDWNVKGLPQGHTDIPLNETGKVQAIKAALAVSDLPITKIISSPLSRAFDTAQAAAKNLNLEVQIDDKIIERHYGKMEGVKKEERYKDFGTYHIDKKDYRGKFEPIGSTDFWTFEDRVTDTIIEYVEQNPSDTYLFVAHGGVFLAITHKLVNEVNSRSDNAVPYLFEKNDNTWSYQPV